MIDKIFPHNEHKVDRTVRVLVGIALLAMVFAGPKTLWGLVGLVPLVTGFVGSCPLYTLLGLNTCPVSSKTGKTT